MYIKNKHTCSEIWSATRLLLVESHWVKVKGKNPTQVLCHVGDLLYTIKLGGGVGGGISTTEISKTQDPIVMGTTQTSAVNIVQQKKKSAYYVLGMKKE